MADDETTTVTPTPNGTPPAAVAQQPSALTFSPEEFEARLQQERNAAAAAARREAEGRLKPKAEPPKQTAPAQADPQSPAVSNMSAAEIRRLMAFNRAIGQHGLSDEQTADLEQLLEVQRPENVSEWVASKARLFGKSATPIPNTQPSTHAVPNPAVPVPTPIATSPTPAPSTSVPNENPDDVMRWTEAPWAAYVRRNGAVPGNPYHWANYKVHQELARKAEASMATKRVVTNKR